MSCNVRSFDTDDCWHILHVKNLKMEKADVKVKGEVGEMGRSKMSKTERDRLSAGGSEWRPLIRGVSVAKSTSTVQLAKTIF
ncbi:unnamed protein product [Toxocara canis]|uniref:Uncharacterized protein n=1 Tax=Toxocara canis TaxID=6265 RepID=A0A183UCU6_TOXCA|nr:unnamed protein product [Toxocara canis]